MSEALGDQPSMRTWYDVFVTFLSKKILSKEFSWEGFWMEPSEIEESVAEATYHYGMERLIT